MFRFPIVGSFVFITLCSTLPAYGQFQPLLITLDHNDDFVVTGTGQEIVGIEFVAPEGTFEAAPGSVTLMDPTSGEFETSIPAPFQVSLEINSAQVIYGVLGPVPIRGSYPMYFGPTDLSLLNDVQINIAHDFIVTENPMNFRCDGCEFPEVSLNANGGIEITNINDPIQNLTFYSKGGGLEVTELPLGITVAGASPTQLTITSSEGILPDALSQLDFLEPISAIGTVFAEFTLADAVTFGPFAVDATVPEPDASLLFGFSLTAMLVLRRRSS